MKKAIAIVTVLLAATGCASMQGMTPEQLEAAAKSKDANAMCTKANSRLVGDVTTVYVNIDKGVITDGALTVSPDCAVTFTNKGPAKP